MQEKRQVSPSEAAQMGVTTNHEQMPNGEYRFRLGARYIITLRLKEQPGEW